MTKSKTYIYHHLHSVGFSNPVRESHHGLPADAVTHEEPEIFWIWVRDNNGKLSPVETGRTSMEALEEMIAAISKIELVTEQLYLLNQGYELCVLGKRQPDLEVSFARDHRECLITRKPI